jgi:serine acetyltransferase
MGRDALVMGGVTIGDGAVIAARAVVTKNVAAYETAWSTWHGGKVNAMMSAEQCEICDRR